MLNVDVEADRRDFTVRAAFDVADGERVALFGPSGAGKTTVLEVIAGLVEPRSGRIELGGRTLTSTGSPRVAVPPWERRVGLLRQDPGAVPAPVGPGQPDLRARRRGTGRGGRQAGGRRADRDRLVARHRRAARGDAGPAVRRPAAPGGPRPAAARALRRAPARRAVRFARRRPAPLPHRARQRSFLAAVRAVRPRHASALRRAGVRRPAPGDGRGRDLAGGSARPGGAPPRLPARRGARGLPRLRPRIRRCACVRGERPVRSRAGPARGSGARPAWSRACTRTAWCRARTRPAGSSSPGP